MATFLEVDSLSINADAIDGEGIEDYAGM